MLGVFGGNQTVIVITVRSVLGKYKAEHALISL